MERSQAPKILRLAPDSMFVSFLCPFFAYTLSVFFLFLPFILSQGLQGPTCASLAHYRRANRAHYIPGGFLHRSLIIYLGFMPRTCVVLPHVPFLRHYMHRYDLSFGQAGLPGSCIYALRSH